MTGLIAKQNKHSQCIQHDKGNSYIMHVLIQCLVIMTLLEVFACHGLFPYPRIDIVYSPAFKQLHAYWCLCDSQFEEKAKSMWNHIFPQNTGKKESMFQRGCFENAEPKKPSFQPQNKQICRVCIHPLFIDACDKYWENRKR